MRARTTAALLITAGAVASASIAYGAGTTRETTQRRIRGVITSVDPANVTIAPLHGHSPCVTGRIDPTRTRVIVDGHPGRAADLRITENARAELALDDVWMTIRVDTVH